MPLPRKPIYALVALLALAAIIYWPGLAGGFVFDDYPSIVNNASLRLFNGSLTSLWDASLGGVTSPWGRPISMASFAVNYYWLGDSPYYFKLVNLTIHLANGLLVYVCLGQLWPQQTGKSQHGHVALWVTAVWLLHPINLTPVLFVVQRMTSLASLFTLAALNLYLLGRRRPGWKWRILLAVGFLAFWLTGILSKETALSLPLLVLLCEWLVFHSFSKVAQKYRLLLLGACCIVAATVLWQAWPFILQTYLTRDFTLQERLLTQARVLWLYVAQIALPYPELYSLHHDDIAVSHSFLEPWQTAIAVLGWVAVVVTAVTQRLARPWLIFGIFWFLAGHLLESSFLGLELAYEHRNYLPSIGPILLIAFMLFPANSARWKVPRYAFAWGFLIFCAVLTSLRAQQWGDDYIRTQLDANSHPGSARTHNEAARAILDRTLAKGFTSAPGYFMSRKHFQRAASLDKNGKAALIGILFVDCSVSVKKDDEVFRELLARFAKTPLTLADQSVIQNLSDLLTKDLLCLSNGEVDELITAALTNPMAVGKLRGMLHALAMDFAAAKLNSLPIALKHALLAVESDQASAPLRINLVRVLLQMNRLPEARLQYEAMLRLSIPPVNRAEVEAMKGLFLAS